MPSETVNAWEDVPLFDSEQAEADFWVENQVDLRLMESATVAASEQTDSVSITLRMDQWDFELGYSYKF